MALLGDGEGLCGFHAVLTATTASFAAYCTETPSENPEKWKAFKETLREQIDAAPQRPGRAADIARYRSDEYLDDLIRSAMARFGPEARRAEKAKQAAMVAKTALPVYWGGDVVPLEIGLEQMATAIDGWGDDAFRFAQTRRRKRRLLDRIDGYWKRRGVALDFAASYENAETTDDLFIGLEKADSARDDGRRAPLRRTVEAAVDEHIRRRSGLPLDAEPPRLLVRAPAGAGKSSRLTSLLSRAQAAGLVVWVLAPDLALADQLADTLRAAPGVPFRHVVRGRNAENPRDDGRKMCGRHQEAAELAAVGLSATALCGGCPKRQECEQVGYLAQRSEETGVYVMAHDMLFTPNTLTPRPDVVIVDESVWGKAPRRVVIRPETLETALDDPAWRAFVSRLRDALRDAEPLAAMRRVLGGEDFNHAAELLKARAKVGKADVDAAVERGELTQARKLAKELRPVRDAKKLIAAVMAELDKPRVVFNGVEYVPNYRVKVETADGGVFEENRPMICVHHLKRLRIGGDVPILLLDASGDGELTRRALQLPDLACVDVRIERRAVVTQVSTRTFSRTQMKGDRGEELRRQVVDFIVREVGNESALVVSYKGVADELAMEAKRRGFDVSPLHFNKLRGRNVGERCKVAFIVGREHHPAEAQNDARAIYAFDDAPLTPFDPAAFGDGWHRQSRRYTMCDGSAVVAETPVLPDQRAQCIFEQMREREVEQAVDRLRLIHATAPKRVFVLCSLPLDLTVDRLIDWRDRDGEDDAVVRVWDAFAVVPLGNKHFARAAGISERAARFMLKERGRGCNIYHIATTPPFSGATKIRYRLDHQRGSDSAAIADPARLAGIDAYKSALEGVLGDWVAALGYDGRKLMRFEQHGPPLPAPADFFPKVSATETRVVAIFDGLTVVRPPVLTVIESAPPPKWSDADTAGLRAETVRVIERPTAAEEMAAVRALGLSGEWLRRQRRRTPGRVLHHAAEIAGRGALSAWLHAHVTALVGARNVG